MFGSELTVAELLCELIELLAPNEGLCDGVVEFFEYINDVEQLLATIRQLKQILSNCDNAQIAMAISPQRPLSIEFNEKDEPHLPVAPPKVSMDDYKSDINGDDEATVRDASEQLFFSKGSKGNIFRLNFMEGRDDFAVSYFLWYLIACSETAGRSSRISHLYDARSTDPHPNCSCA